MRLTAVLLVLLTLVSAPPAGAAERAVLFDDCHAETCGNANWSITGGFSDFADTFRQLGFAVSALKQGPVTAGALAKCEIFVIGEANTRFTDDEERAIVAWVKGGGRLYLIADHTNSDRNNDGFDSIKIFDRFVGEFGFTFDEEWIKRMSPIPVDPAAHAVLRDVPAVGTWGGTVARITDPAVAAGLILLKFKNKENQDREGYWMVVAQPGKGRVIALCDSSPYDDGSADGPGFAVSDGYNLVDHGHRQLAHNTIAWLAGLDPDAVRIPYDIRLGTPPLNTSPNVALKVPFRVTVRPDAAGPAKVATYLRGVAPENLIASREIDLKAGGNDLGIDFQYADQGLFRVYVDITRPGVATPGRAFTTIKVGRIPRLLVDRSHENDWVNKFKAFGAFVDDEGIFLSDARQGLPPELGKPDVNLLVVTAPKKGYAFKPEDIVAVIDFLKRDGTLILIGTSDSGAWGDGANLKPLTDALDLPLEFNDDTVTVNDPAKNASLEAEGGLPSPVGEAPASLKARPGKGVARFLAWAPMGSTQKDADGDGMFDWAGGRIPIDAVVDLAKGPIGAGRVVLFGSCHLMDWCFKPELNARTVAYLTRVIRGALSTEEIVPLSQILPTYPDGRTLTVSGIVKSFDGKTLVLEDSGKALICNGTFPQGFAARPGAIVKVFGRLVKTGNWFTLEVVAR